MHLLKFVKKNPLLFVGTLMILFLLMITFFGRYLPFIDTRLQEIDYIWNKKHVPVPPPYAPSEEHPLGTDRKGRDMLSLLVVGAKQTLLLVVLITVLRYALAIPLAYLAHKRFTGAGLVLNSLNGLLSYLPSIVIVILLATLPPTILPSVFSRPYYLLFVIAFVEVGRAADMIKLDLDEIATKEFITGGISVGASPFRLLRFYYLPFLYDKLLVNLVTDAARVMFLVGQLAFFEVFISQKLDYFESGWEFVEDSTSWPSLITNAFRDIRGPVWISFYPVLAMTYVIMTFNVFAQGLQNRFRSKVDYFKA
jgi:peptide/nickel transport system permease protein